MRDLRRLLEDVAERGTPVGADTLYTRARHAVDERRDPSDVDRRGRAQGTRRSLVAALCVVALVVATAVVLTRNRSQRGVVSVGPVNAPSRPHEGGSAVFGVDGDISGGWCLPRAELAASGIQVAAALYETLTAPGGDGDIHPLLAESVAPNTSATVWTIRLRPNVVFSDGSPLTARVVEQNLEAYKDGPLFALTLGDVKSVDVVDDLTLTVTTRRPWTAFPWQLWSQGRLGIMGEAQLDSPDCATNVVGTGPFVLQSWKSGEQLVAVKNTRYWRKDAWGQSLPYLDRITFVPEQEGSARVQRLESGAAALIETSSTSDIAKLRIDEGHGKVQLHETEQSGDVSSAMLNATTTPFDHLSARRAVAYAIDRTALNEATTDGILSEASGPFGPGSIGYLAESGFPGFDPAKARQYAAQYRAETGAELAFAIAYPADQASTKTAKALQRMLENVGIQVALDQVADESTLINRAIGRQYQAMLWRDSTAGDPDLEYQWWHCGNAPPAPCDSASNFGGFNDAVMNNALDDGRTNGDPTQRRQDYENVNKEFANQAWRLWLFRLRFAIAAQPDVRGIGGLALPDGTPPSAGLAAGISPAGIWLDR